MSILMDALKKSKAQGNTKSVLADAGTAPRASFNPKGRVSTSPGMSSGRISSPTRTMRAKKGGLPLGRITMLLAIAAVCLYMGMVWFSGGDSAPVTATLPDLPSVEGIVWDNSRPLAILDGSPQAVGDKVRGWEILQITPNQVRVSFQGVREVLTLPEVQQR